MKTFLKLTLCAALIGGLAACGGGEKTNCFFTGSGGTTEFQQSGNVGKAYSFKPINIGGSTPAGCSLSYVAASLPPGLTLNQVTGVISGTPTTVGSFKSSVAANIESTDDGDGETLTVTVNYTIRAATASAPEAAE